MHWQRNVEEAAAVVVVVVMTTAYTSCTKSKKAVSKQNLTLSSFQ